MENSILVLISVDILKHCQLSFQPTWQLVCTQHTESETAVQCDKSQPI